MKLQNTPKLKNDTDRATILENKDWPPSHELRTGLAQEVGRQADETTGQVEAVIKGKRISFDEAKALLSVPNGNFDSDDRDVKLNHSGIDLETALAQSRLSEEDKEAFRNDPELISEEDVKRLQENPELGGQIFFTVRDTEKGWNQIFADRFKALQAVIGSDRTRVWKSFTEYKRVDSKGNVLEDQKPAKACSVTFTPDILNLTDNDIPQEAKKLVGINAYQQREKMAQGVKFLEPDVWMDMFQRGLDNLVVDFYGEEITDLEALYALDENEYAEKCRTALKEATDEQIMQFLPRDSTTVTQFPDMEDENGVVPSLVFHPANRKVCLFYYYPDIAYDYLGARHRLG